MVPPSAHDGGVRRAASSCSSGGRGATASGKAANTSDANTTTTATGTIEQLRIWRTQRRYSEIEPYIDPAERFHFIDTLVAADQVLDANAQAMRAIAELWGEHRIAEWNLAMLGDHLGLFSADIVIVREDVIDDDATVTYQVSGVVPLEDARLRVYRIEGAPR